MADTSVKVSFIGDAKRLKSTIDDVDREIGGLGNKAKSFGSKFTDGFSKALPVLAGVGAGIAVLGSALKSAMADEAEQKKLSQTLLTVAGATAQQIAETEKWIDVTQRATGVADSELRPALDKLVRSSASVEEAQKNLKIAMDVSRGTGKDLDTVAQALAKVLEGNTTAAARLVPELTGIAREGASAEEVMAALAQTFEGQTAVHAATTEGKMQRLNIALDEMQEQIGAKLLPYALKFGDWMLETGIPAIERTAGHVAEWWSKQDELHDSLRDSITQAKAFGESLIPMGEAAWDAYLKVKPLVDAMIRLQQLTSVSNLFGQGGKSVEDIARQKANAPGNAFLGGFQPPVPGFNLASGGTVPGPTGKPIWGIAHGGETVVPNGGGGITIIVQGSVLSERDLIGVLNNAARRGLLVGS